VRNTSSDWRKVDTDLASDGKITTDVPHNGNCLYASVALAIRQLGRAWVKRRAQELKVAALDPISLRFLTAQQLTLSPGNYRDSLDETDYAKARASVPAEIWAGAPPESIADDDPGDAPYQRWARGHVLTGVFACHVCITALCSALQLCVRVTGRNLLGKRLEPVVVVPFGLTTEAQKDLPCIHVALLQVENHACNHYRVVLPKEVGPRKEVSGLCQPRLGEDIAAPGEQMVCAMCGGDTEEEHYTPARASKMRAHSLFKETGSGLAPILRHRSRGWGTAACVGATQRTSSPPTSTP
jgi:hypothetical protein